MNEIIECPLMGLSCEYISIVDNKLLCIFIYKFIEDLKKCPLIE